MEITWNYYVTLSDLFGDDQSNAGSWLQRPEIKGWYPLSDGLGGSIGAVGILIKWGAKELRIGYGSIPINTIFSGMNIHLPAILGFTRYQGFDPSPIEFPNHFMAGWGE